MWNLVIFSVILPLQRSFNLFLKRTYLSPLSSSASQGAERLGFVPEKIPRNAINCVDCGHCCHGCPYESKQSTQTALFEPLLLDPRYQIEVSVPDFLMWCCFDSRVWSVLCTVFLRS